MADHSNIDQVMDWLRDFLHDFNMLRPGKDQNLGRDLAHVAAGWIALRAANEGRGANEYWLGNTAAYAEWKQQKYGWIAPKPNYRTGQMLSQLSLMGGTTVTRDTVEMKYGTGQPPQKSYSPTQFITAGDQSITDIEKAWLCSQERPFYEADQEMEDLVIEAASEALSDYILEFN